MLDVSDIFKPPDNWHDTPAQAQVRACLTAALEDLDPISRTGVAGALIEMLRDQVLAGLAHIRKESVIEAKGDLTSAEIAEQTGLTKATVARLLYVGRRG